MISYDAAITEFWLLVEVGEPMQCWPWTGTLTPRGYGVVSRKARAALGERLASRISCRFAYGPGDGMLALHSCDNPICCNPKHLRWGTKSDNYRDVELSIWMAEARSARLRGDPPPRRGEVRGPGPGRTLADIRLETETIQ